MEEQSYVKTPESIRQPFLRATSGNRKAFLGDARRHNECEMK